MCQYNDSNIKDPLSDSEKQKVAPQIPTILLVDDDEDNLRLCSVFLKHIKAQVLKATSAANALNILGKRSVDLLVVDVVMPEVSGFTLLEKLRESGLYSGPILMLTGLRTSGDVLTALRLGASDYICKPVEGDTFLARVTSLLKKGLAGAPIEFVKETTQYMAEACFPMELISISENDVKLGSRVPIGEGTQMLLRTPLFREIRIDSPMIRVTSCQHSRNLRSPIYEIKASFMGMDEAILKKIRKWIQGRVTAKLRVT